MDAFQVRMDFQALLKRLNASQQSIEKVLSFADRHVAKASADLWDCILNECGKVRARSKALRWLEELG
jgi:CTD kinase subunit gamma